MSLSARDIEAARQNLAAKAREGEADVDPAMVEPDVFCEIAPMLEEILQLLLPKLVGVARNVVPKGLRWLLGELVESAVEEAVEIGFDEWQEERCGA